MTIRIHFRAVGEIQKTLGNWKGPSRATFRHLHRQDDGYDDDDEAPMAVSVVIF